MKYEVTNDKREIEGQMLNRLRLTENPDIVGGWVHYRMNINENCAIGQDALIFDHARVEDSNIGDSFDQNDLIFGQIKKEVPVEDSVILKGNAYVRKSSVIEEHSILSDVVEVKNSRITRSQLSGSVRTSDSFIEHCRCSGSARIFNADLLDCEISGCVEIYGGSMQYAYIQNPSDFVIFSIPKTEEEYQMEVSEYVYKDLEKEFKPSRSRSISFYN